MVAPGEDELMLSCSTVVYIIHEIFDVNNVFSCRKRVNVVLESDAGVFPLKVITVDFRGKHCA